MAFTTRAAPVALRLLVGQTLSMRGDNDRARDIAFAMVDFLPPGESLGISQTTTEI